MTITYEQLIAFQIVPKFFPLLMSIIFQERTLEMLALFRMQLHNLDSKFSMETAISLKNYWIQPASH